jgi:hypothetical protein
LQGRIEYIRALSLSNSNITNITNYFELRYLGNPQTNQQMPLAHTSLHAETLRYYPLYYMAMKVHLDLEIMNG